MDRLTTIMVRLSLSWLVVGFVVGAAMLTDRKLPGDWRVWLTPGHAHMLFVGWFLQFVLGIAYWLLPRKRTPELPYGYRETVAFGAVMALNLGLALRVVTEAWERAGHASDGTFWLLALSALLQLGAAIAFVSQLWGRTATRKRSNAPQATASGG